MTNPAIVVPAFSRVESLRRVLGSLSVADYPPDVPLVISIDLPADERLGPGNREVQALAASFQWNHGPKEVLVHDRPVGLVNNIYYCAGLAEKYGAAIVLEDDLVVARRFYDYACRARDYYEGDSRIAGIALNAHWYNGFTLLPFLPLLDDGDVFFMQLGSPQGQLYTAEQWSAYRLWRRAAGEQAVEVDDLHPLFEEFPDTDWLHVKAKFLTETGRYYVYPRESLTSNFGDEGTHFVRATSFFQVPLQQFRRDFRYMTLDDAIAVYDSFFEIEPSRLNRMTERVSGYNYAVDLNASRPAGAIDAPYVLTTRSCSRPLMTFGAELRPLEANVIEGIPGARINFAATETVDFGRLSTLAAHKRNRDYFGRHSRIGLRRRASEQLSNWLKPPSE